MNADDELAVDADRWIPVTERLPEPDPEIKCRGLLFSKSVLMVEASGAMEVGFTVTNPDGHTRWETSAWLDDAHYDVTHWRYLPAEPQDADR